MEVRPSLLRTAAIAVVPMRVVRLLLTGDAATVRQRRRAGAVLPVVTFSLLALLLSSQPLPASDGRPAPALHFGTITIRNKPLFSGDEAGRGFYRRANLAATRTPEALIRGFLLFREGDAYDPVLLGETERNLRALDFLISAKVTAGQPHDGLVDVVVETEDAWTTDVNADFSNDGGRSLYDFDVTQKDLFGTGAEADVRLSNGRERRTRSIELLHPALFGPYWNGDALLASSSDGGEVKLAVERPLFSNSTRRTLSVTFDHLRQDSRLYEQGAVAALFRQQHAGLTATFGRTLVATEQSVLRLLGGVDLVSDTFRPVEGTEPDDRHFRFLEAGVATNSFDYLKLDHVDLGIREQDFNLGLTASAIGGWSPPLKGKGSVWRLRSDASYGRRFAPRTFAITRLSATTRAGDANRNAIVSADSRFVARFDSQFPLTFIARARIDRGWDLDREVQFFADGQNGLRAYPNFAFTGSSRIVLNAEQRLFLGREWLDLFEPGVAVFADSGRAGGGPLRTDAGAGLRLGIARFESTMLRLDVAYAFNDSPLSRRGMVISFATAQAF